MLTRSLFEDMVDAHWVCVEPGLARERLTQHLDHTRLLFNETAADFPTIFDPENLPSADPSQRPALDKIFGNFGHKSWTGLDIHRRSPRSSTCGLQTRVARCSTSSAESSTATATSISTSAGRR
jgi:hypothetical protein